jgi:hypothetical protein
MSLRLLYFCELYRNLLPFNITCTNPALDICGNTSGIFGGLLAFAFDNASGSHGLSGWQW